MRNVNTIGVADDWWCGTGGGGEGDRRVAVVLVARSQVRSQRQIALGKDQPSPACSNNLHDRLKHKLFYSYSFPLSVLTIYLPMGS